MKSLHDYVRKTDLTFEEWEYAIDFLTRTGQKCTDIRQEFILLSDVLGVSMLVDAVNHRDREGATETTVLGPFYVGEHKVTPHGTDISPICRASGCSCRAASPISRASRLANVPVDVWHADDDGFYDSQKPSYATRRPVVAGALRHRRRRPVLFPHHPAVQLSDPDRRSGRRDDHRRPAATRCGRRMCISWSLRPATSR